MKVSRKIWGGLVFAIGALWMLGGIAGYFQGHGPGMFILVFCGVALLRLGFNLIRG
jgi:hypothetical protein